MQGTKALQGRVIERLLTYYYKYRDALSFDDMILVFFEVSLIKFAERKKLFTNDAGMTEKRARLYKKFSGCLCSGFFGRDIVQKSDEKQIFESMGEAVDEIAEEYGYGIDDIGGLFELLINLEYTDDEINESIYRSDNGMYFSNPLLVKNTLLLLLKNVGKKQLPEKTFIDPAMGAGVFIFELLDIVKRKLTRWEFDTFIRENVYGVDKNPVVVDIFRVVVYIKYLSNDDDFAFLEKHFQVCDSLMTPISGEGISWGTLFPEVMRTGGFHYVIGNPPWGRIKSNIREYHLVKGSLTREAQGAELKRRIESDAVQFQRWEDYQKYINGYSRKLKESKEYNSQQYVVDHSRTGGDADLYKYFLELSFHLLREGGYIGYIIPASFYMSEGATGLRHLLLENGTIKYLLNFENKRHIFPIHPSFKFIVLIYFKDRKAGAIQKASFDLTDVEDISIQNTAKRKFVSYSRKFLQKCSGEYWTVPECRNVYERTLIEKLYDKHAVLGETKKAAWGVSFNREFDMTLDSEMFVPKNKVDKTTKYYPLYEGRMVGQYHSSNKCYVKGTGRTAIWKNNTDREMTEICPQYYIKEKDCPHVRKQYRAAYCEITGQKNRRTVLASLIAPEAVCGNKVPTVTCFPSDRIEYHLYWLAVANSFVIDWIIRKKITITLNFYHWMQTPFPKLPESEDAFRKIAAWSALIIESVNGYRLQEQIKDRLILDYMNQFQSLTCAQLRMEIDMAAANLFEVTPDEMACIMYDFPSIDDNSAGIRGDKKYNSDRKCSYVTRDMLLYEMRVRAGLPTDVSIVAIYKSIGIDIQESTGEIDNLNARIDYYKRHGCRLLTGTAT